MHRFEKFVCRFEKFMHTLAQYELEKFDDIYSDAKWLEGKTARKNNGKTEVESTPGKYSPSIYLSIYLSIYHLDICMIYL